jgi:glutathione S-transferase
VFLTELEVSLIHSRYLCGNNFSLADAAIFPFIRQFSGVDNDWFRASAFRAVNKWLEAFLATELFGRVMAK